MKNRPQDEADAQAVAEWWEREQREIRAVFAAELQRLEQVRREADGAESHRPSL